MFLKFKKSLKKSFCFCIIMIKILAFSLFITFWVLLTFFKIIFYQLWMCLPRPLWCLCIKIAWRTRVLERRETCRSRGAISTTFLTVYYFQFYKLDTVDTEKFWFDSSFCHRIYLLPFFFSFCWLSLILDFKKNENLLKPVFFGTLCSL